MLCVQGCHSSGGERKKYLRKWKRAQEVEEEKWWLWWQRRVVCFKVCFSLYYYFTLHILLVVHISFNNQEVRNYSQRLLH